MDRDAAARVAERTLREIEDPAVPLALAPSAPVTERSWCWVFPFNSAAFLDTGDVGSALASGPLVVPKDGGAPWVAPSALPVAETLAEYERTHEIDGHRSG